MSEKIYLLERSRQVFDLRCAVSLGLTEDGDNLPLIYDRTLKVEDL